jgi:hypothetical protein
MLNICKEVTIVSELGADTCSKDYFDVHDLIVYDSDFILNEIKNDVELERHIPHYRQTPQSSTMKDVNDFALRLMQFAHKSIVIASNDAIPQRFQNHLLCGLTSEILSNCLEVLPKPIDVQGLTQTIESIIAQKHHDERCLHDASKRVGMISPLHNARQIPASATNAQKAEEAWNIPATGKLLRSRAKVKRKKQGNAKERGRQATANFQTAEEAPAAKKALKGGVKGRRNLHGASLFEPHLRDAREVMGMEPGRGNQKVEEARNASAATKALKGGAKAGGRSLREAPLFEQRWQPRALDIEPWDAAALSAHYRTGLPCRQQALAPPVIVKK